MKTDVTVQTVLRDGRHWWLFSDGRTMPAIQGGADSAGDGAGDGGSGGDGGTSSGGDSGKGDGGKPASNAGDGGKPASGNDSADGGDSSADSEVEKWKALARKHESDHKKTLKELDAEKKKNLSDDEKRVAEAKDEGKREATQAMGGRLVAAEFRAHLAGRMADAQRDAFLEGLDTSKFLTDDGDVDTDKVKAHVEAIAPKNGNGPGSFPDLGQGRRQGQAKPSVQAGRDLYESRHGAKKS